MYKKVIASEYILQLLLYEKKKFHIRVHMLFLNNNGKITYSPSINNKPYIFTIPGITEQYDANIKKKNKSFGTYWIRLYGINPNIDSRKYDNKHIIYQINIMFAPYNTFVKNALA